MWLFKNEWIRNPVASKRKTYFHRIDSFSIQSLFVFLFYFLFTLSLIFLRRRWLWVWRRRSGTSWGRGWARGRWWTVYDIFYLLLLCLLLLSLLWLLDLFVDPYLFLPDGSTVNRYPSTFLSFISFTAV